MCIQPLNDDEAEVWGAEIEQNLKDILAKPELARELYPDNPERGHQILGLIQYMNRRIRELREGSKIVE